MYFKKNRLYKVLMVVLVLFSLFSCEKKGSDTKDSLGKQKAATNVSDSQFEVNSDLVNDLIQKKQFFKPGKYLKNEIPAGEYIFVSSTGGYFSEELQGQIIDNENFNSFGYVNINGIGKIEADGYLLTNSALIKLGFKNALEMYEKLAKTNNYNFSAMYKVGSDIDQGIYELKGINTGYYEINSGPVGHGSTIKNDLFQSKTISITVKEGEYLKTQDAVLKFVKPYIVSKSLSRQNTSNYVVYKKKPSYTEDEVSGDAFLNSDLSEKYCSKLSSISQSSADNFARSPYHQTDPRLIEFREAHERQDVYGGELHNVCKVTIDTPNGPYCSTAEKFHTDGSKIWAELMSTDYAPGACL